MAGSEEEKRACPRAAERGSAARREVEAMRAVEVRRADCMLVCWRVAVGGVARFGRVRRVREVEARA